MHDEHRDSPRIMIIDNDEGLVQALAVRLRSNGYTCVTATTGAQGLSAFLLNPTDLIISDLNMPAGDGIAMASSIRNHSDVPIIFVTGFQDDFRRRLRNISNVTVFRKPFDMNDLLEVVEAELALRDIPAP